jgi:hypothetical protein
VKRVFISYAHRDGGDLAVRLQPDLEGRGFDVWLDQQRLKGGDRWTNEIEQALDRAQVVLALLSDGSFTPDTCRAEQGWALDAGKRKRVHMSVNAARRSACATSAAAIGAPRTPLARLQRPHPLRRALPGAIWRVRDRLLTRAAR